jgi:hypothetical protein
MQKQAHNNMNPKLMNKLKPISESYQIDSLSEVNTITSADDGDQSVSKGKNIKDVKKNILNNLNKRLSAKSNLN